MLTINDARNYGTHMTMKLVYNPGKNKVACVHYQVSSFLVYTEAAGIPKVSKQVTPLFNESIYIMVAVAHNSNLVAINKLEK